MFRLVHLTDPHVGPLPRPRLRELLGKRITGYVNWRRGRKHAHDMALLANLVADVRTQRPDHIACTGDVCNIGLASEWPTSRVFLEALGPAEAVSFVPGNHDAYVPGALEGLLAAIAPFVRDDAGGPIRFPYLRRRGAVALVGLSSAVPTAPLVASGRLGKTQMALAEGMLTRLGEEGAFRCVMVHHPPHRAGAPPGRNLTDARAFEAMIARTGAELILHGHNHIGSVATIPGPKGPVPVVGAPSASALGGAIVHRAEYFIYDIDGEPGAYTVTAERRGLSADGSLGPLGKLFLTV
ncbi:MAG TPA: metallophosphoesterase [Beijerinckiaceae bacterium]|jgi:3',5'-cyclic AMP phosphodiesterase CpdA